MKLNSYEFCYRPGSWLRLCSLRHKICEKNSLKKQRCIWVYSFRGFGKGSAGLAKKKIISEGHDCSHHGSQETKAEWDEQSRGKTCSSKAHTQLFTSSNEVPLANSLFSLAGIIVLIYWRGQCPPELVTSQCYLGVSRRDTSYWNHNSWHTISLINHNNL